MSGCGGSIWLSCQSARHEVPSHGVARSRSPTPPRPLRNARAEAAGHLNAGDRAVLRGAGGLELDVPVLRDGAGADAVALALLHGVALPRQGALVEGRGARQHDAVQRHLVPGANTDPRPTGHILQ